MRATLDRMRRNGDDGFTLIELLIVIVILGILAAIVVFSVRGITDKGNTAACKTTVSTIDTAYEAYIANGGTGATSAVKVSSLTPNYLHTEPANGTKIGSVTYATATTTVADVDGATC